MTKARTPKRGKRGPKSDAAAIAEARALMPDPGEEDWAREARRALVKLARFAADQAEDGKLDPLIAVGMFRTLAQAVNVREAIVDPPKPESAAPASSETKS